MPLQKLQFRPGVNREGTTLANEGGWFECDKVRFRSGFPEKIGGWSVLTYTSFLGVCRSMWCWITQKNFNLLGVGTNLKFYVENGGTYNDITPIRLTTGPLASPPTAGPSFTTVAGSTTVTVIDTGLSGAQVNDFVTFSNATLVGGLDLNGEHQIITVINSITYTITVATPALTSVTGGGGGAVTAKYQINTGSAIYTTGTGWGTGPWPPYLFSSLTNPFSTTSGSQTITVTQTAHGLTTGDSVFFQSISAATVGGVPSGTYKKAFKVTVTNPNTYTISTAGLGSWATPTVTNAAQGGTVVVNYPSSTLGIASTNRGWGTGYTIGIGQQLRLWSQANFGEYLLFNPRGGAIYIWQPGPGTTPNFGDAYRGVVLSPSSATPIGWTTIATDTTCPDIVSQILVSDASRIVIAFGANDPSGTVFPSLVAEQDPLLIRWSDQESYRVWTPTPTNQAGDYRLSRGSLIIGALQTRQEILVWTDTAVYSMQYVGAPYVWGFTLLADNISIMSQNAMATAAGITYWMGTDKFYVYSGRVETLPCSLRTYVYSDINLDQDAQIFASTNEAYSEIWWFYCSSTSTIVDRYVVFNYLDRVWYYGSLGRTAWLDTGLRQYPVAATANTNLLVYHESSPDDGTTNPPSPIYSYVQSSDFDIGDGHNYGFAWRMIPDITFDGSTTTAPDTPEVNIEMIPRQNPGAPYGTGNNPYVKSTQNYTTKHYYTVQEFTEIVYTRVRGRQMAFKISSNTLGTQWQLGVPRLDVRPDGRR